ncbi:hypothetical protein [Fulvivirga lutimaris]|uniref:hypothetical protein n=1 Tax=Fulvivirga lutimaris TaxID=1819566 RepID=UPI0012BCC11E|nr:hypothetical protein [Fulvivirga lutimaris]
MENYKFLKKGLFESLSSFQEKLNAKVHEGWKVVNFTNDHNSLIVLLERVK